MTDAAEGRRTGLCVQAVQCSTCIYSPSSTLNLAKLEAEARRRDSFRVCHHSDTACCAGFWARHKNDFNLGRIAQRLGMVQFVHDDRHAEAR